MPPQEAETEKRFSRADFAELLAELRVAQAGVQILFVPVAVVFVAMFDFLPDS